MTWVKLDDQFIRHRKTRQLSHRAIVLHVAGLCHCAAMLTDGRIERDDVAMLITDARVNRATLAELVAKGQWHDCGDHYVIHDYLEYQESRDSVLIRRKKWADKKAGQRGGVPGGLQGGQDDMSPGESQGVSHAPVPSRPVPSSTTESLTTTHHHPHGGGHDEDDGRFAAVVAHITDLRIKAHPAKRNPLKYRTTVTASVIDEWGDTIRDFLATRPDVPADVCAAALALDIA